MSADGLHRIRWSRAAVARVHWTAARDFVRDLVNIQQGIAEEGVENVGKRTPSDPMETGCRGKSPPDRRETVRERLNKYATKYSSGGGGKCRQTDSIGSDGDGLPWQES